MDATMILLLVALAFTVRYLIVLGAGGTSLVDPWAMPGMGTPAETTERAFLSGNIDSWFLKGVILDSTTVDARSTVTTDLQNGLVLGKITSSGNFVHYNPAATDGSQIARGILYQSLSMLDSTNTAVAKQSRIVVLAMDVKAAQCATLDILARRQLAGRIWFDDDNWTNNDNGLRVVVPKTTSYTVLAADNNTAFTTKGAAGPVTFTLPTLARGLRFKFMNEAGQNMLVTAAVANTLVAFNNLTASTVALQTAGNLIGSGFEVVANSDASKWLVLPIGAGTVTVS